ncbi:hypothetical protein AEQ67_27745 [Pseudomonas sp. RIT-PI-q]|nr:hypothetical protein AEQ67_27745 [Pseudomonas sp. RIT-PI-q]
MTQNSPAWILPGTAIPPIGGVIMADFFFRYRGQYPRPLAGIAAAALTYVLLTGVSGARTANAPLQDL